MERNRQGKLYKEVWEGVEQENDSQMKTKALWRETSVQNSVIKKIYLNSNQPLETMVKKVRRYSRPEQVANCVYYQQLTLISLISQLTT